MSLLLYAALAVQLTASPGSSVQYGGTGIPPKLSANALPQYGGTGIPPR